MRCLSVTLLASLPLLILLGCRSSNSSTHTTTSLMEYRAEDSVAATSPTRKRLRNIESDYADEPSLSNEGPRLAHDLESQPTEIQDATQAGFVHSIEPVSSRGQDSSPSPSMRLPMSQDSEIIGDEGSPQVLELRQVISSVHQSFPLLELAYLEADAAAGKQVATQGAFDTKLKAATENGPTSFYETYRHSVGVTKPIYSGGEFFSGYRIGRGTFEPWYLERQTNDGGEFKTGFRLPLAQNRAIDERRAELWRATYEQQRVQPVIRAQLIGFVRDATIAYWEWIAAGLQVRIGEEALNYAIERNKQFERRAQVGDIDPPILQDNLRTIALRESKLIDRRRKLQQSAIKLSLYLRDGAGTPTIPDITWLHNFPVPGEITDSELERGIQVAIDQRPEIAELAAQSRQVNVDLAQAQNETLPTIDAVILGAQDVGEPTSSKRDKSRFEVEAGVYLDVPLERRKARGKMEAAQAKLGQIAAKRRFTEDKIVTEVQSAWTAVRAAFDQYDRAQEARRLAEYMADIERRKFELGESDLLAVFLREQSAIEAADGEVEALLLYFAAQADYAAALAIDWPADAR